MEKKSLQQIKDEYAVHLAEIHNRERVFQTWDEMMYTDFEYGNGISKLYSESDLWYNVCILSQQQALKNASENAKSWQSINLGTHGVDKQSILNENNLVK